MASNHPHDVPFGDLDRLLLQQLLTRQSLAERRATQSSENDIDEQEDDTSEVAPAAPIDVPDKWRLVGEGVTLHSWQRDCLAKWLALGKGTVKVATGGGKTIFALAVAQALQNEKEHDLRLAIVVPTIPLMHQWRDELAEANLPTSTIGLMGGGENISDGVNLRILICVLNSARDRLPGFVQKAGWASRMLLIVDECHRANATEASKIFLSNPKYTLGLSATPETDQGDDSVPSDQVYAESDVGRALGPIIFEFSLRQSLAAGLLTPFEVWHVGLPLNAKEKEVYARLSREISELRRDLQAAFRRSRSSQSFIPWCQTQATRGGGDAARFIGMASERKRLVYRAGSRADLTIRILLAAMQDSRRKVIVFHETIEEIDRIFLAALEHGIPAVLEHSKLPQGIRTGNIDAFRRGIARTIVSAKSLVEGFNVPSADLGIIAASSGSVRQRIQSLGRMLRRKEGDGGAIIFVLYVRDTEDESIYQKADWESVIGAQRNRYFQWDPGAAADTSISTSLQTLQETFVEQDLAPRKYLPPCVEIEPAELVIGEPYPAQPTGIEMKVDQAGNLRLEDESLVRAPTDAIAAICEANRYRRAVRTPCGHLIVRSGDGPSHDALWTYLGDIALPEPAVESDTTVRLMVKSVSGRRVIACKRGRNEVFARSPEKAQSPESGKIQVDLLKWIHDLEGEKQQAIRELCWDGRNGYWIELGGERLSFDGASAPLEFRS
ncbi:MAG TPA: hypothetical protein DCQ04_08810 [Actinobacteria bacterium]|nr:hypothetical protein [Actinomycetota bacterium]